MKKLILMAVCLVLGNVCMTVPASAEDCQTWECKEEQRARTEYMRREAELMKKKAEYLEHCQQYPSLCK